MTGTGDIARGRKGEADVLRVDGSGASGVVHSAVDVIVVGACGLPARELPASAGVYGGGVDDIVIVDGNVQRAVADHNKRVVCFVGGVARVLKAVDVERRLNLLLDKGNLSRFVGIVLRSVREGAKVRVRVALLGLHVHNDVEVNLFRLPLSNQPHIAVLC